MMLQISSSILALCAACANGQPICTDILLRRGAKITVRNLQESPPLHLAVSNGNWQVTELILKSDDGPNSIDHTDGKGCTALMMAAKEGHSGLIELIINFRPSASSRQKVLETTDKQGKFSSQGNILTRTLLCYIIHWMYSYYYNAYMILKNH